MSQLEHVGGMLEERRERERYEKQTELAKAMLGLILAARHQGFEEANILKLVESALEKYVDAPRD